MKGRKWTVILETGYPNLRTFDLGMMEESNLLITEICGFEDRDDSK